MPLGLVARLRRYRRPAVMIAAGLMAVEALLAGLATAQATTLMLTPSLGEVAGFAVICHGDGGAGSDYGRAEDPAKSDPSKNWHPCCLSCAAGAPQATLPEQLIGLRSDRRRAFKSPFFSAASILIAPRAVRAGPSQAPPSLD
jgi:hypothetical protein